MAHGTLGRVSSHAGQFVDEASRGPQDVIFSSSCVCDGDGDYHDESYD